MSLTIEMTHCTCPECGFVWSVPTHLAEWQRRLCPGRFCRDGRESNVRDKEERLYIDSLKRSNAALRGAIKRMQKART